MVALIVMLILFPFLVFGGAWLDAWAIRTIWDWYLQPEYGAAPSMATTLGAMIILRIITTTYTDNEQQKKRSSWEIVGRTVAYCVARQPIAVAIAWAIWKVLL